MKRKFHELWNPLPITVVLNWVWGIDLLPNGNCSKNEKWVKKM